MSEIESSVQRLSSQASQMAIQTFGANNSGTIISEAAERRQTASIEQNDEDIDLAEQMLNQGEEQENQIQEEKQISEDQEMADAQGDEVIPPSKVKFNKYLEEQRQREQDALGTFGEGPMGFNFDAVKIKVDRACKMENVTVMQDYSCVLTNQDVAYNNMLSEVRVFKMQLLERGDKQKWMVWNASGKQQEGAEVSDDDQDEYDADDYTKKINDFFNKADAVASFEKIFREKTGNKWADREYFKEKAGKFTIQDKEKKKNLLKEAFAVEKELKDVLTESSQKFTRELDSDTNEIIQDIFSFEGMKKFMSEMGLDMDKLPLGKLNMDNIQRGHQILKEIQRLLVTGEKAHMIPPLTNDFYCTIPHNFGIKKPLVIDHLLRVKEKTRMLEQIQDIINLQSVYQKTLAFELRQQNPSDALFRELCVKLTKLDKDGDHFQIIYQSIENSQAKAYHTTDSYHFTEYQKRLIKEKYQARGKQTVVDIHKELRDSGLIKHTYRSVLNYINQNNKFKNEEGINQDNQQVNSIEEEDQGQMSIQVRDIYEINKPAQNLNYLPFETKMHNKFLLWQGSKTQSIVSILKDGIRMPSADSAQTGYMFGKGIYFTDCFSKAALQCLSRKDQVNRCYMVLSEVALGDMHKAFAPHQFKRSAPMYCHSVYGVGQQKPKMQGMKDICQPGPEFAPNEDTYDKPNACFLNTGVVAENPDLEEVPVGQNPPDLKFNDYVVYDESQIKMRYLIDFEIILKGTN